MRTPWPFVGRDRLLATVREALDGGRHVTVTGPPGVGKTRLVGEVVDAVAGSGVTVHRVVGSPSSSAVPLAAVSTLLGGATSGDLVAVALERLGADGRTGPADPVLFVDDGHALDEPSAALVHQLALSGRVLTVTTIRDGEPLPPAIARLVQDPDHVRIAVPPLTDDEVAAVLRAALPGPIDGRTVHRLVGAAAGNALSLREVVEGARAAGHLDQVNGTWRLDGPLGTTHVLEELVRSRLDPLPDDAAAAMELLAVGGALDMDLALRIVAAPVWEQLERASLAAVRVEGADRTVEVAHPLHGEALRARLGEMARLRIYRTLAEAAVTTPSPTPVRRLQLAMWQVRGGLPLDPTAVLAAARQAMGAGDVALGAELAGAVHRATGRADAALVWSWCVAEIGDHQQVLDVLGDGSVEADDPWEWVGLRQRIAEEWWWWARRPDRARAMLEPDGRVPAGPWLDLLSAQGAVFDLLDGDLRSAGAVALPLLDHEALWVRLVAALAGTQALSADDRADEGERVAAEAFAAAAASTETLGDPGTHLVGQLLAMVQAGRITEAVDTVAFLYEAAAAQPAIPLRAWAATLRGWTLLHAGRPGDAVGYFLEGETLWAGTQIQGTARWCVAGVVLAAMNAGEHDTATAAHGRLDGYDPTGFRLYETSVLLGQLWIASHEGRLRADRRVADDVLAEVRRTGSVADASFAAHELARLGVVDTADAVALLDEYLAGRTPGPLVAARRAFAEASVQQDADGFEEAGDRFERIGATLFAAEAFDRATMLHRRAGRAADARRLAGRAAQLLAAVGEVRSPLLTVDAERPGGLSKREEQIARLAADGWSNKRIADHLYLGERTIESHLYRAFQKLGVTSRAQLADALRGGASTRTA